MEQLNRQQLADLQLSRLNQLLAEILPANDFYQARFKDHAGRFASLDELTFIELTTKDQLVDVDCQAGYARNLTYPIDRYSRFHRTSGTKGRPMIVLDTLEDWVWWLETWQYVLDAAELSADDRVVMAFSFGPFIGFWSAFDAITDRRAMAVPTGAMSSKARLELIKSLQATVVCCTPSYALHLAEIMEAEQLGPDDFCVKYLIVAGEPGGSIPEIRTKIESTWGATVVDHSGASEVGPWGFADKQQTGIHVNETQYIAEFLSIDTGQPAVEGELSELILTCLGRAGSPVIRYRTGDLVKPSWNHDSQCQFVLLKGGVLGRTDDMMIIRGVNVFPTSVEAILRRFPEIREYRMTAFKAASMDQLKIEIEDERDDPQRVKSELELQLGFRIDVETVPLNSLPRFEAKGKRFIDQR